MRAGVAVLLVIFLTIGSLFIIKIVPIIDDALFGIAEPSVYENWQNSSDSIVITWHVQNATGKWAGYRDYINAIFKDARGWQRAGIDFKQVDASASANITIRIYDNSKNYPCGENDGTLRACASSVGLSATGCTIYLPDIGHTEAFTMFANHEMGHCMGFYHRDDGLMRPTFKRGKRGKVTDGPFWPTILEVKLFRNRLKAAKLF